MKYGLKPYLKSLLSYTGPALIVSMAYMDPGNYGTAIQAGASTQYSLLWSVVLANMMAMLMQYLSGKFGIAAGRSLPEQIRLSLRTKTRVVAFWLAAELAIAATDLAEYLGTVIALNILFGLSLLYASVLGALDVLLLLMLASKRFRTLEYFFMLAVSVISIGFLYEIVVMRVDMVAVVKGFLSPSVNPGSMLLVVGIIGATVMPHALFLHSDLAKNRLGGQSVEEKQSLRRLHLVENIIALSVAGLVNAAILITSAVSFYPQHSGVASVDEAYRIMEPLYGQMAATVFAVTLLFSGIASSTTGTVAGQAVMEGLLGISVNRNLRRFVTRVVNVVPTTAAILIGLQPLQLLVYSQVVLSLMLPLPVIPLVIYTSRKNLMGNLVNRRITTMFSWMVASLIIVFNTYLLISLV
ncbi:MAG: Nramp family divalent metal transporter [Nitrososphaerota archaeon]